MKTNEIIDLIAEAICQSAGLNWDAMPEYSRAHWKELARAALSVVWTAENDRCDAIPPGGDADIARQADLVCEALVREITHGARWTTIVEAGRALVVVRQTADSMAREHAHPSGATEGASS